MPSSEGLIMRLEASLLYRLDPARAPDVFQRLGDGYSQVVISPNFRSVMRAVTAAHTASTLYSEGRETVARQMLDQMQKASATAASSSKTYYCAISSCPTRCATPSRPSNKRIRKRNA